MNKMIKKMKLVKSILVVGLGLFLSSCSSDPNCLSVIPKESNAVMVVNLYSIAEKGKLEEIEDYKFFKAFQKEVRRGSKGISNIIEEFIQDPNMTGIDFTSDVFAYHVNDGEDEMFGCVSAVINNETIFEEFIKEMLDEADADFDIEVLEEYKYAFVEDEIIIGWDSEKAVLVAPMNYNSRENLEDEIELLFELKEKKQITSNERFTEFYAERSDVSVWLSSNVLEDLREFRQAARGVDFDLEDNLLAAHLTFEKDKFSMKTKFTANEDIQKLLDKHNLWDNNFNPKLLSLFPEESYALASFSVNSEAYFGMLKENEAFDDILDEVEQEVDFDLEDVFESIGGSVVYSLFGFDQVEYTYLDWGYGFNEYQANKMEEQYTISEAGALSYEDKEMLNAGKTIQCKQYNDRYCIDIKNILAEGGNIESTLENNSKINWYEGGWEFGLYDEVTNSEMLPLMGIAFDIMGNKMIKKLLYEIPEEKLTQNKGYYEFKFDNRYPAYLAFNEETCFITNDKRSIKKFEDGGYSKRALSNWENKSNIENNSVFGYLNLDYSDYPKEIKNSLENDQNSSDKKVFNTWDDVLKSTELKYTGNNTVEYVLNFSAKDINSLNVLLEAVDDSFKALSKKSQTSF